MLVDNATHTPATSSPRSSRASSSGSSRKNSSRSPSHSLDHDPSTAPATNSSLKLNDPLSPNRVDVNDSPHSSVTNRTHTGVTNSPVPPALAVRKEGFQRAKHSTPSSRPDSGDEGTRARTVTITTTTTTTTTTRNGETVVTEEVKEDISTSSMPTDACAFSETQATKTQKLNEGSTTPKPRPNLAPLSAAFSDDEEAPTKKTSPKLKNSVHQSKIKEPVNQKGFFSVASPPSATKVPMLKFSPRSPKIVSPNPQGNSHTARTPTTTTSHASPRGHYSARVVSSTSSPYYSSKGRSLASPLSAKTGSSSRNAQISASSPRSRGANRTSVATVTEVQRHVSDANFNRQQFAVRQKQLLKKEAAARNDLQKKERHEMVAVQRWRDVSLAYVKQVSLGIISRTALAGPLPLNLMEGSTSNVPQSPQGPLGAAATNYTAIKRGNHPMTSSPGRVLPKKKEKGSSSSALSVGTPARTNSVSMVSQSAALDRDNTFGSQSKNEAPSAAPSPSDSEGVKLPAVREEASITSPGTTTSALEATENSERDTIENEERKELRTLIVSLFVADIDPDWVELDKSIKGNSTLPKSGSKSVLSESLRPPTMKTIADRMLAIAAYEYYEHRKGRVAAVSMVMSIIQPELPPPRKRAAASQLATEEPDGHEEPKKATVLKPIAPKTGPSKVGVVARAKGVRSLAVAAGSPVRSLGSSKLQPLAPTEATSIHSKPLKGGKIGMKEDTQPTSWIPLSTDENSQETSTKLESLQAPASPKLSVIKKKNSMMMPKSKAPTNGHLPRIGTSTPLSMEREVVVPATATVSPTQVVKPLPAISPNKPPRSGGSSIASTPSRGQISPSLSMSINGRRRESLAMRRRSEDDDICEAMANAEREELERKAAAERKSISGAKSPRPASNGKNSNPPSSRAGNNSRLTARSNSKQGSSRPSSRSSRPQSASSRPSSSRPSSSRAPSSRSASRPPTTPAKPSTRESLKSSMEMPIETTVFLRSEGGKQDEEEYYSPTGPIKSNHLFVGRKM